MSFSAPLWLAALAAVALPLLIHLLSRGQQRRVRVGSVRLLQAAAGRRGRRPRLTEPGLLALRAGLLAALALALAGPRWPEAAQSEEPPGWLLVAPQAARALTSNAALAADLERLRAQGHQVRRLETGLGPGMPEAGAAAESELPARALWSLLREADLLAPAGAPFYVFAGASAGDLDGVRPALRRRVEWKGPDTDLGAGRGDGSGELASGRDPQSGASSLPLAVAILAAPERAGEERYLRAAFAAIAAGSASAGATFEIRTAPADGGVPVDGGAAPNALTAAVGAAHLIFWLSEEPLPAALVARIEDGAVAVVAATGDALPCDRLLLARIAGGEHRVELRRCPPPPAGAAVWRDDGGVVRLGVQAVGTGLLFRYGGALDPAAGDLVTSAAFPEWVGELAAVARARAGLPAIAGNQARWRRAAVAPTQAAPRSLTAEDAAGTATPTAGGRDAAGLLWLLVALLLGAERLLAARRAS